MILISPSYPYLAWGAAYKGLNYTFFFGRINFNQGRTQDLKKIPPFKYTLCMNVPVLRRVVETMKTSGSLTARFSPRFVWFNEFHFAFE